MKAYLRLARLQTSGVTALAPVFGYLAAVQASGRPLDGALFDVPAVPLLLAMGLCAHIFGFVHNEIADREADARAAYRRPKPLPSGEVTLRGAWALALGALAAGLACAAALALTAQAPVLALAAASVALAVLYNGKGKSIAGGDAFLAASIAVFVMTGAAASSGVAGALSQPVLGVAAIGALVLFFNNALEGGFKDHESDRAAGKRTLVLALRARGEKLGSPDGLLVFAQLPLHAAMFAAAAWLAVGPMHTADPRVDQAKALLAAALAGAMVRLYNRAIAQEDRRRMLARFSAHEGCALLLLLTPFLVHLPIGGFAALFAAPLLVFVAVNRAVHGTSFAPDV
jgi:4-hydroxybenzoate polyprenyltransferase